MKQEKVALILSGCGYLDGAEITEAVALNIALSHHNYEVHFFAPDRAQRDLVDHQTGESVEGESRNILKESARIARGNIRPITELKPEHFSAIAMAGGFGVVKNFTTFLDKGEEASLLPDIAQPIHAAIKEQVPILSICASPLILAIAAKELNLENAEITFGAAKNAGDFLSATDQWGVKHIETEIDKAHVDFNYRFITSGAYMYGDAKPFEVFASADAAAQSLKQLLK